MLFNTGDAIRWTGRNGFDSRKYYGIIIKAETTMSGSPGYRWRWNNDNQTYVGAIDEFAMSYVEDGPVIYAV